MPLGIPDLAQAHDSVAAIVTAHPDLQGVVLDLRDCPGGSLAGAIKLADEFLDGGTVIRVQGRNPKDLDLYGARPGDVLNGKPIVVLINQDTASGAEILAAALQDRGRAKLVGLATAGNGKIDAVIPLSNSRGGAIRLTTAFAHRVSGAPIQNVGITPDFIVAKNAEEATSASRNGQRGSLVPIDAPPAAFRGDYQEKRALDLIASGTS